MNTLFYSFTIGVLLTVLIILFFYFMRSVNRTQLQQMFCIDMFLMITSCVFAFTQAQFSKYLDVDPIFFASLYYIGIIFYPVALYFTVEIFINIKINFKKSYILLFIIPVICLLGLWTNGRHQLFFKVFSIETNECEWGPLYILDGLFSNALYLIASYKLIKHLSKNSGLFKGQAHLLIGGIVFPLFLDLVGAFKLLDTTVYLTPIALSISLVCFTLALFRYHLLDTMPIALSKIVDRISDGFIVLNEKNVIVDYNFPFLQIFQIENLEINSQHLFDLLKLENFSGLDEKTVINALKSITDSDETLSFELEFDNLQKFLRLEINNIKSDDMLVGSLILVKDITQHHTDIETIRSNQNILIEKERLASLGQLISGVAHNLKTPIFSISGATEGLSDLINEYKTSINDNKVTVQDHLEIAHDMEVWNDKIKEYLEYMSDIVTAIRGQAASFTEESYETFTIDEVMKRVNILMKHELQQALITLNVSYDLNKEVKLQGNMNSLVQIINNLISNAIQSYNGQPNNKVNINITNTEKTLKISIRDYGCGIPLEVKDKLFKEIISTKDKNTGTGLGLFISYSNLKTQLKGDLTFESELNKGTTFEITLPII